MSDLIDRQAAIDAVKRAEALARAFGYHVVVETVRELPSAGPEIVRCKDCKRQDTDNAFHSMWCYEMRTFVKPNEFCSFAERRTDELGDS